MSHELHKPDGVSRSEGKKILSRFSSVDCNMKEYNVYNFLNFFCPGSLALIGMCQKIENWRNRG
jgi:hypothetical protein